VGTLVPPKNDYVYLCLSMATRDHTLVFNRLRSTLHRKYEPIVSHDQVRVKVGVGVEDQLGDGLNELDQLIKQLGVLHVEHQRIFNLELQKAKEGEIDSLSSVITTKINDLFKSIKALPTNSIIDKNRQKDLSIKLNDKLFVYNKIQKLYIAELKKQSDMPCLTDDKQCLTDDKQCLTDDKQCLTDDKQCLTDDKQCVDDQMYTLMTDERVIEINKLAKSVEQLAVLFRDLNTLIFEQGTILDRIDYNIDSAVTSCQDGKEELLKAETYQKSARPMWCIFILLALILVMVVVIIVRHV
jgi:syntaxin 16